MVWCGGLDKMFVLWYGMVWCVASDKVYIYMVFVWCGGSHGVIIWYGLRVVWCCVVVACCNGVVAVVWCCGTDDVVWYLSGFLAGLVVPWQLSDVVLWLLQSSSVVRWFGVSMV